jgi:hypothetical protein
MAAPPKPGKRLNPRLVHGLRTLGRFVAISLLAVELLYFLAVNTVLNLPLIPRLLDTDDIGMQWTYAISMYPGQVTVHGFFMRLQDANIQFTLSIGEAQAHFTFKDMLHRTFHITRVDGRHAIYLMRMRRTPAEVAETDLSTLPLLEGFPAVPLRRTVEPPPSPPKTPEEIAGIWTVHIEGVHQEVDEGWFEGLRYRGPSTATGSFSLKPQYLVIVDGHWHVAGGAFTLGHDPLADNPHGDASVRISPFDPSVTPGNEPLRYLDGLMSLEGRLSNARFLNPVLSHTTAPHFGSAEGNFELYFHFDRGLVGTGTRLRIKANDWQIGRGRYVVTANYAQLDSTVDLVDGIPTSLTNLDLGPYQVQRTKTDDEPGGELITGDGMVLRLSATALDTLGPFFSDLGYEFKLHEARMSDLRRLNVYLPGTGFFEVLGGEGTLSGDFVSPADGNGHGAVDIAAKDAAARVQRVRLGGGVRLHLDLTGVASDSQRFVVVGQRPLGAKGNIEGHLHVARPDDFSGSGPEAGGCEITSDFTVDPLTPPELAREGIWHFLSAVASVTGRFEGLDFINGLLARPAPITLSGGAGSFSATASLDHGRLGTDSHIGLQASGAEVDWGDYRARADANFSARLRAHDDPAKALQPALLEGELALRQTRLQASDVIVFTADEVKISGTSTRREMGGLAHLHPSLTLHTTHARIPDLRVLNRYLPRDSLRLEGGSAEIQADLTSPASGEGRGSLALSIQKVEASMEDLSLRGGLHLTIKAGGLGEAPWREGIWDRTRLTSSGQLEAELSLRPGPESPESGLAAFVINAAGELPPLPAGAPPRGETILRSIVAHATLDGELQGIGYLNRFLAGTGLRAEGGNGNLHVSAGLASGEITPGSWGHLTVADAALRAGSFALASDTDVTAVIGPVGPNRLSLGLGLDSYELHYVPRREKAAVDPVLFHGSGLRLEVRSDDADPAAVIDVASVHADMGDVRVPDLRALNLFLPASKAAVLTGGQARLVGTLDKPAHGKSKASLELKGTKMGIDLEGHHVVGDFRLTAKAATVIAGAGWNPPSSVDLSGSGFALSAVSFDKETGIPDGWWTSLQLPHASLGVGSQQVAVGTLDVQARDLQPIFVLFKEQLGLPGILTPYLGFEGLHGNANLLVQPGFVEVTEADLKSTRLRLRGRILEGSAGTTGDLLLNDPPLAFGIALHPHGTGVQIWGAEGWYSDQLKTPLAPAH